MDGNGYYDDLPKGQSVNLTWTANPNCNTSCNIESINTLGFVLIYNTNCGGSVTTPVKQSNPYGSNYISESGFCSNSRFPANIVETQAFTVSLDVSFFNNINVNFGTNGRYRYWVKLPVGMQVVPTSAQYNGTSNTPAQEGDTMIYTLPAGLKYNSNFTSTRNCTGCVVSSSFNPAGNQIVEWRRVAPQVPNCALSIPSWIGFPKPRL